MRIIFKIFFNFIDLLMFFSSLKMSSIIVFILSKDYEILVIFRPAGMCRIIPIIISVVKKIEQRLGS